MAVIVLILISRDFKQISFNSAFIKAEPRTQSGTNIYNLIILVWFPDERVDKTNTIMVRRKRFCWSLDELFLRTLY